MNTYRNPEAADHVPSAITSDEDVATILPFHRSLPIYNTTPLIALSSVTVSNIFPDSQGPVEFPRVFVKDESSRFSLDPSITSSFKILGASVALHRALCTHLKVPFSTNYKDVSSLLLQHRTAMHSDAVELVSCTDGNWGRALAKCAGLYAGGLPITIFVPVAVDATVVQRIRAEGPHVTALQISGNYDAAIAAAREHTDKVNGYAQSYHDDFIASPGHKGSLANQSRAVLLLDTSFAAYTRVPAWVTLGYSTCLREVDHQLQALGAAPATVAVCSVGVGSWAHAVVAHYKSNAAASSSGAPGSTTPESRKRKVACITVEPTAAPSLLASLHNQYITSLKETDFTIMEGMNCGTTSDLAWPILRGGVDIATVVTDKEAHEAVLALEDNKTIANGAGDQKGRILAGPCGAAPLAALKKLLAEGSLTGLTKEDVVVLFSTEGQRSYGTPA